MFYARKTSVIQTARYELQARIARQKNSNYIIKMSEESCRIKIVINKKREKINSELKAQLKCEDRQFAKERLESFLDFEPIYGRFLA